MEKLINIRALNKTYIMGTEKVQAIRHIDLDVYRNEFIALMGPSGSGKSTLMNVIGCLDTPTSGEYIFNNKSVGTMTDNELAAVRNSEIGFIFQVFNLLPRLTALDNVALPLVYAGVGRAARQKKAEEVLELVGLGSRKTHTPNELSGGQRQRVAIARALVNNPSLLLADEPTGNLDSKTSLEIMDILVKLHEAGNTIILVTHEPDIATFANRNIILRDGMVETDQVIEHESTL